MALRRAVIVGVVLLIAVFAAGCGPGAAEESATQTLFSGLTSTTANTLPPDLLTTVPAASTSSTVREGVTAKTVLVFGDSVSLGYYATTEADAYITKLASWLKTTYDVSLFRLAWPGSKAEAVAENEQQIMELRADVLILQTGTGEEGAAADFAESVRTAIEIAQAANPDVRIVICSAWRPRNDTRDLIDSTLQTVAEQTGATFVYLSALRDDTRNCGPAGRSTWQGISDAGHPNDAGHQAIFEALAPVVEGLL